MLVIDVDVIDELRFLLAFRDEIISYSLRLLKLLLPRVDDEVVMDVIDVLRWYLLTLGGETLSRSS